MCIGVLSDTHLPHRLAQLPASVVEVFAGAGVDLILHAGDVDDPGALEPLSRLAPVVAVRGNVHLQDFSRGGGELPAHVELVICGRRLILTHGYRSGVIGFLGKIVVVGALRLGFSVRRRLNRRIARRLHRRFSWADVVVFGHSHEPFETWLGHTFFFNPGAVAQDEGDLPSVGILTLGSDRLEAKVVLLPDVLPQRDVRGH